MTELKNCPFCNGEAQESNDGGVQAFSVFCTDCFAATPRHHHYTDEDTEENAAKAWNTRQAIDATALKEIVDFIDYLLTKNVFSDGYVPTFGGPDTHKLQAMIKAAKEETE